MGEQIPFREAVAVWWRIGLLSFGGPAGQIALMHRLLVEEKKWLDEDRFLHALNYCMLLPGPEAQQLATYSGWLLHGVRGGVVAGVLFIVPGALAILMLSWMYVLLGNAGPVAGLFLGLKAAVLAVVVQALLRIARRALGSLQQKLLALAGFLALFVFSLPFPLVVAAGAGAGYLLARKQAEEAGPTGADALLTAADHPGRNRSARLAAFVCLGLWAATLSTLLVFLGTDNVFTQIAGFFSRLAVVTFGGAYAVLAYVAQQGVEQYQWLQPGEMLDGLGLAETTPGPLILVTQFVGFLAALRQSGMEPALLYGTLGALLTLWVTFLPCFLWIFAGAPYVEKLRHNLRLSAALKAITAVVVGVIANLALWFALNVLFAETRPLDSFGLSLNVPVVDTLNFSMLALTLLSFVLMFVLRLQLLLVLGLTALAGIILTFL
ncbi:MAG: chromate efflux transporter [Pseudomonadales bacterium]|nr:chromate efflux transporter [Pseudomonadales bacterium]